MARTTSTKSTSTTKATAPRAEEYRRLPLTSVHPDPANVRLDLGDLTELANSIRDGGVREPLVVYPHPTRPDEYLVLFGHRRRAASEQAGATDLPCLIRYDLDTEHARTVERLIENLNRLDLTAIEEATAYEQLVLAGVKPAQISRRTGRSPKEIASRRRLMGLQDDTRAKIQARQITLDDATALVEFAGDKAATKRLEAVVGTDQWRWTLQQEHQKLEMRKKRDTALADLRAAGARIATPNDIPNGMWNYQLTYLTIDGAPERSTEQSHDEHVQALIDWHATAHPDAHAAHVGENGRVTWLCLQPATHRTDNDNYDDDPADPADPADENAVAAAAAERAAAEQRREQYNQAVATAAGIRRQHLDNYITLHSRLTREQEAALAGLMVRLLAETLFEASCDQIAPWVGVEGRAPGAPYDHQKAEETEKQVQDTLAKMPGPVGLLTLLAAEFEDTLAKTYLWSYDGRDLAPGTLNRGWLTVLTGSLGYELTDWEKQQLAAIDAHQAATAVGAGAADDEDGEP